MRSQIKKREKEHKDDVEALFYVEKNQLSNSGNSTQNMQHQYWLHIVGKTYTDDPHDVLTIRQGYHLSKVVP